MARGTFGATGGVGDVGTCADSVAAKSAGAMRSRRFMASPLEVIEGEIGGGRANPRHDVVLVECRLDEMDLVAAMARIELGDLRQYELEVLQQVVQPRVGAGRRIEQEPGGRQEPSAFAAERRVGGRCCRPVTPRATRSSGPAIRPWHAGSDRCSTR